MTVMDTSATDADAVASLFWYHTMDLPGGITTPGEVDCRPIADRILVPERLDGLRVLDIGTWDGFWAFELERRGADVVTVDVADPDQWDWPPRTRIGAADERRRRALAEMKLGEGFRLAHRLLGSSVQAEHVSVYDLSPERVGTFDLVNVGSVLVHLRDPVRALEAVRSVARGPVVLNESFDLVPTLLSPRTPRARLADHELVLWWQPNLAAVGNWARSAGLRPQRRSRPYFVPYGAGEPTPSVRERLQALRTPEGRERLVTWVAGIPHVSILTQPEG